MRIATQPCSSPQGPRPLELIAAPQRCPPPPSQWLHQRRGFRPQRHSCPRRPEEGGAAQTPGQGARRHHRAGPRLPRGTVGCVQPAWPLLLTQAAPTLAAARPRRARLAYRRPTPTIEAPPMSDGPRARGAGASFFTTQCVAHGRAVPTVVKSRLWAAPAQPLRLTRSTPALAALKQLGARAPPPPTLVWIGGGRPRPPPGGRLDPARLPAARLGRQLFGTAATLHAYAHRRCLP